MQLAELFLAIRENQHLAAIYDELADYLTTFVDDTDKVIPTTTGEPADVDYVRQVLDEVLKKRQYYLDEVSKLEASEVILVQSHESREGSSRPPAEPGEGSR